MLTTARGCAHPRGGRVGGGRKEGTGLSLSPPLSLHAAMWTPRSFVVGAAVRGPTLGCIVILLGEDPGEGCDAPMTFDLCFPPPTRLLCGPHGGL